MSGLRRAPERPRIDVCHAQIPALLLLLVSYLNISFYTFLASLMLIQMAPMSSLFPPLAHGIVAVDRRKPWAVSSWTGTSIGDMFLSGRS